MLRHEPTDVFTVDNVTGRMLELLIGGGGHRREEAGVSVPLPRRSLDGRAAVFVGETHCVRTLLRLHLDVPIYRLRRDRHQVAANFSSYHVAAAVGLQAGRVVTACRRIIFAGVCGSPLAHRTVAGPLRCFYRRMSIVTSHALDRVN